MPAVRPPLAPMLARVARELPRGPGWTFEPKWDGFRCLAFRDGDDVDLRSRHGNALARYFPEVVAALRDVPERSYVLDGELLVERGGIADFTALMARLHPAASRVARLAAQTPAHYVAFDLLADGDGDHRASGFAERRKRLERLLAADHPTVRLTPATTDPSVAERWLDSPLGGALDGVVAKADGLAYEPGRRAMLKVKRVHTADCVVAGVRLAAAEPRVSSLLLGLWDGATLRHAGVVQAFPNAERLRLVDVLAPYVTPLAGHPWEAGFALEGGQTGRLPGSSGRWAPGMSMDWVPLRPELVVEVAYSQLDGVRFRHPAVLVRWRPDREAASCTVDQLRAAP